MEVIEEEEAQNNLKQRIRQKEARRKLELANAQYEIWMDSDVKAERDLEVKSRDRLGSSQSKKELSLQAKPFSPAISHAFPSSSSQLIKSGAKCKDDIIRAPCKVSISTSSVYNSTTRRQQRDKDELGESYFGQSLKSEARTTVNSAQFPSTAPRNNMTMISAAQSEGKRGSQYKALGSQSVPLRQSNRVNFAPEMTSDLYDYRSAGVGQYYEYFPDETVDKPGPSHTQKRLLFLCYILMQ